MRFIAVSVGLSIALGVWISGRTDGTLAQELPSQAELHVVSFYESEFGTATVKVQRPGKRVLLVLT